MSTVALTNDMFRLPNSTAVDPDGYSPTLTTALTGPFADIALNAKSDQAVAQKAPTPKRAGNGYVGSVLLTATSGNSDQHKKWEVKKRVDRRYDIFNLPSDEEIIRGGSEFQAVEFMDRIIRALPDLLPTPPPALNLESPAGSALDTEPDCGDGEKETEIGQSRDYDGCLLLEVRSGGSEEKWEVQKLKDGYYDIFYLSTPGKDCLHRSEREVLRFFSIRLKDIPLTSSIPIGRPVSPPRNSSGEPMPEPPLTMSWVGVAPGDSIPSGAVQANDDGTLYVAGQVFEAGQQAGAGVAGPTDNPVSSFSWNGSLVDPAPTTFGVLVPSTSQNAVQWVTFPTSFTLVDGELNLLGTPQPIPLQLPTDGGSLPNGQTIIIRISGANPSVSTGAVTTLPTTCDILCYGSAWF